MIRAGRCRRYEGGGWKEHYLLFFRSLLSVMLFPLLRRHLLIGFLLLCPSQQPIDGRKATSVSYLLLFSSFLLIVLFTVLRAHLLISFFLLCLS